MSVQLPELLQRFVDDFSYCQGREKLEYLLELARELEPLPPWLTEKPGMMVEVQECMSPVFVHVENRQGTIRLHLDVPDESPSVRGYAVVLQQGLDGITVEQLLSLPPDIPLRLGLQNVLSQQRLNGISALLARLKQLGRNTN